MTQVIVSTPETAARRYSLLLTTDDGDVAAAQALRHRVFADELGARLDSAVPGRDVDRFDAHCDHLVVREDATGEIVGTYRMLPPQRARAAGGLYADGEFDLTALDPLRSGIVETGRSCVHPDHRGGAVVGLAWAGLARYMLLTGHRWLIGCASVSLADGGAQAAGVWDRVRAKHLAPPSTAPSRSAPGTRPTSRAAGGSPSRRCCAATCGWAPGCAGRPRTTRTSASRTSRCCWGWTTSTSATCASSWARTPPG